MNPTITAGATVLAPAAPGPVDQVARLAPIPAGVVERMRHEALSAPTRGVVEYGEYQSGGWWTAALLNHSGEAHDTLIRDGRPRPTTLLEHMPTTRAWLEGLGLDFMFVRLARLESNAYLWEHRDYADLADRPRVRLHVPLVSHPGAVLVTAGSRVHLATGWVWRLTPTSAHGVCNELGTDRLHLIADVYDDPAADRLAAQPHLEPEDTARLPELTRAQRDLCVGRAARMARLGFTAAAEHSLLRLYFAYALPEGGAYDLVARMHEGLGDHDGARRWRDAAHVLLAHGATARIEAGR